MNNPVDITPENSAANELAKLTRRAQSARMDIIVVVLFTVINITLLLFGSLTYFLFSVSLPYYLCYFMSLYTGRMPAEAYGSEWDGFQFLPDGFFWSAVVVSAVVLAMYAVCFFASQSKKKNEDGSVTVSYSMGWLIAALVLFSIDTLIYIIMMVLLIGFQMSMLIDLAIHIYVIVTLVMGVISAYKLKKLNA